jgi:hypothetical protein
MINQSHTSHNRFPTHLTHPQTAQSSRFELKSRPSEAAQSSKRSKATRAVPMLPFPKRIYFRIHTLTHHALNAAQILHLPKTAQNNAYAGFPLDCFMRYVCICRFHERDALLCAHTVPADSVHAVGTCIILRHSLAYDWLWLKDQRIRVSFNFTEEIIGGNAPTLCWPVSRCFYLVR